jgi:hypothetical protein
MHTAVKVHLHAFLTSALDVMSCQFHAPTALPRDKEPKRPHGTEGSVQPRVGLEVVTKRNPYPYQETRPGPPNRVPVIICLDYKRIIWEEWRVYEIWSYNHWKWKYEGVSKSFRTGRLERELQMLQLSATRCSCTAVLWASILNFASITLCVASQWVIRKVSVYFFIESVRKLLDTPSYYVLRIAIMYTKQQVEENIVEIKELYYIRWDKLYIILICRIAHSIICWQWEHWREN